MYICCSSWHLFSRGREGEVRSYVHYIRIEDDLRSEYFRFRKFEHILNECLFFL